MSNHTVQTTHIQRLIENGLHLAKVCDGAGQTIDYAAAHQEGAGNEYTINALEKAAADLRHAAEELTAERLSLLGWPQA